MTTPDSDEQMRLILDTGRCVHQHLLHSQGRHMHGAACVDMSLAQIQAARLIQEHGKVTVTELARCLGVSPPSASAMVERLAERGIVTRERSREDRRCVVIRLSPKAMGKMQKFESVVEKDFKRLVARIGPKTTRDWYGVMKRIRSVLDGEQKGASTDD